MAKKKQPTEELPPDPPETVEEEVAEEEGEEQAVEEEAEQATPSPAPVPTPLDREKVIKVDLYATGGYVVIPTPRSWYFDRRISLKRKENRPNGSGGYVEVLVDVSLEHVEDDADGVWCYRTM